MGSAEYYARSGRNDPEPLCLQSREQPSGRYGVDHKFVRQLLICLAVTSCVLISASGVNANPAGGTVTTGAGTISQSSDTMTITQTSDKLGINWQS
ncbi:MAG: hypothetical protein H6Q65_1291, partial [Firmicutes bacterium]|nr:hypothetical protein [Bacillota bacterium]